MVCSPSAFQKTAGTENYQGVMGLISYRGSGDPVKSAVIIQIKDGQAQFYKSIDP